jgi:hypothetical protein
MNILEGLILVYLTETKANLFIYGYSPYSSQYGIVLYQNYKIPQQRKTLSHFSTPVVSLSF